MSDSLTDNGNRIYSKILQSLYLSSTHTDVILVADHPENRFNVHKCILSAASEYFSAMFSGSFKESRQEEINITSIDSVPLGIVLRLIYGFNVEFNSLRDEDLVMEVLKAANLLQIDFIVEYCWSFLLKRISQENCWTILRLADMMMRKSVYDEVISFIGAHLKQFWKSKEILEVDAVTIENILKSNDLKVQTEEDVFFLMVAWINHDMDERFKYCPQLLKYIRLNLMTEQFITENIKPLAINKECREMIEKAIDWFKNSSDERSSCGFNISPRKTIADKLIAVIPFTKSITIHGYCPLAKVWTKDILNVELSFKPKVLGAWRGSLVLLNEKMNLMHLLSMDTGDLTQGIELARRSNFSSSCWKTFCYIIGGMRIEAVRSVQRYNFHTEVWTGIPSMNVPRQSPASIITSDGVLYAIGGGSYERAEGSVEYLNLVEKDEEWTNITPMPYGRFAPHVVECKRCLYVFGGYTIIDQECCLSTVQKYDLETKEWTVLGNSNLDSVVRLSVGAVKDQIFLLSTDHKRKTTFGLFNMETISFDELISPQEMEAIDHKFHAAQLYYISRAELFAK